MEQADDIETLNNKIEEKINKDIELIKLNNQLKSPIVTQLKRPLIDFFTTHDPDNTGYIYQNQLINFLNKIRRSLYQSVLDDKMLELIHNCLSPNEEAMIEYKKFEKNLLKLILIQGKPGKQTEKRLKKAFYDFDTKRQGNLDISDLRLLFDLLCDLLKVERLEQWQLENLVNLLDNDMDKTIDFPELLDNYLFILENLLENKPQQKSVGISNLFEEIIKYGMGDDRTSTNDLIEHEIPKENDSPLNSYLHNYNVLKKKINDIYKEEAQPEIKRRNTMLDAGKNIAKFMLKVTDLIDNKNIDKTAKDSQDNVCIMCKNNIQKNANCNKNNSAKRNTPRQSDGAVMFSDQSKIKRTASVSKFANEIISNIPDAERQRYKRKSVLILKKDPNSMIEQGISTNIANIDKYENESRVVVVNNFHSTQDFSGTLKERERQEEMKIKICEDLTNGIDRNSSFKVFDQTTRCSTLLNSAYNYCQLQIDKLDFFDRIDFEKLRKVVSEMKEIRQILKLNMKRIDVFMSGIIDYAKEKIQLDDEGVEPFRDLLQNTLADLDTAPEKRKSFIIGTKPKSITSMSHFSPNKHKQHGHKTSISVVSPLKTNPIQQLISNIHEKDQYQGYQFPENNNLPERTENPQDVSILQVNIRAGLEKNFSDEVPNPSHVFNKPKQK